MSRRTAPTGASNAQEPVVIHLSPDPSPPLDSVGAPVSDRRGTLIYLAVVDALDNAAAGNGRESTRPCGRLAVTPPARAAGRKRPTPPHQNSDAANLDPAHAAMARWRDAGFPAAFTHDGFDIAFTPDDGPTKRLTQRSHSAKPGGRPQNLPSAQRVTKEQRPPSTADTPLPAVAERAAALFADLPDTPDECFTAIQVVMSLVRQAAAASYLREAVNAAIRTDTTTLKRGGGLTADLKLANQALRECGLAVGDPVSGEPCTLVASGAAGYEYPRLHRRKVVAGEPQRVDVPAEPLTLVEAVRQESFADREHGRRAHPAGGRSL